MSTYQMDVSAIQWGLSMARVSTYTSISIRWHMWYLNNLILLSRKV
jgi:hypothetical protein